MTTSSLSDRPARVLFLGTPSNAVALDRWTELQERLDLAGIETTTAFEGEVDYAILTEDILDGYCTAVEALILQKLRARGITCASTCAGPEQILAALAETSADVASVVPISTARGSTYRHAASSAV
ncbi:MULTISPECIES: hypothetical protein [Rhodococcus]|uniref:hypothetical protein n=1 Tax=Rhodococcus TaxID=1827 RepID=UPI000AC97750|nr:MULTISPECIES: hypothetical protein [Rhodococcus]MCD2119538.1 hypothetical protein [Rhodococcus pyridinivorans]MCZ4628493.1 hypothetical protein [Rhodococcus pyridinivorans]MCZ4649766.1 hypothetical protein [Rhodococcus pyridinivorans]MDJ0484615.1 hypothetical protein [Rhodococcus pyridinivorans]MDV7255798.1 hypothetical protein [Rhodococcus pyridinivorans]